MAVNVKSMTVFIIMQDNEDEADIPPSSVNKMGKITNHPLPQQTFCF